MAHNKNTISRILNNLEVSKIRFDGFFTSQNLSRLILLKFISLNLEERKVKREESKKKQLARANERLAVLGKEPIDDLENLPDDLDELDPFLDETAKITFDLVSLGKVAKK